MNVFNRTKLYWLKTRLIPIKIKIFNVLMVERDAAKSVTLFLGLA